MLAKVRFDGTHVFVRTKVLAKVKRGEWRPSTSYVECMFANVSWWTKVICSQLCWVTCSLTWDAIE